MFLLNECDRMSDAAAYVWLEILETLPPKSVVVFTTNDHSRLPQRLRDRCEAFIFQGQASALAGSVEALIAQVWKAETGRDDPPALNKLADSAGNISFRRVLQRLTPLLLD